MTFLVAWRLLLLLVVAAFAVAWVAAVAPRRRNVVRFTDVALLDVVAPDRSAWRRHVPAALWLLALALLVTGFARPARDVDVAEDRAVVILALDVSLSMEADDVAPTRLDAAKEAATEFIGGLPEHVDVGLVLFSGTIEAHAPTADRSAVISTIDDASLRESTAIGEAIYRGVDLIEEATRAAEAGPGGGDPDAEAGTGDPDAGAGTPAPGRIVVLSDGATSVGRPDAQAAGAAAAAGVPVDTISFGTPEGVVTIDGATDAVPVAPGPLQEVADITGGDFHEAETLDALAAAYQDIGTVLERQTEQREIGGWFTGSGLLLLALAGGMSLMWSQRLP